MYFISASSRSQIALTGITETPFEDDVSPVKTPKSPQKKKKKKRNRDIGPDEGVKAGYVNKIHKFLVVSVSE